MPVQDFDIYHGGAVGPPQGWVGATTGSGTITYNQDVRGGSVTLATGATQDSKAILYLDSNVVQPSEDGSFQIHLSAISAVTSVTIRAGLMLRADWAALAVGGALAALANDYFIYDFTVATDVDWILRWQTGAAGALAIDGDVDAVTTTTKLIAWVDQQTIPFGYVNGINYRQSTPGSSEVPNVVLAPGIVISNTTAADRTVTVDMISWEGRRT